MGNELPSCPYLCSVPHQKFTARLSFWIDPLRIKSQRKYMNLNTKVSGAIVVTLVHALPPQIRFPCAWWFRSCNYHDSLWRFLVVSDTCWCVSCTIGLFSRKLSNYDGLCDQIHPRGGAGNHIFNTFHFGCGLFRAIPSTLSHLPKSLVMFATFTGSPRLNKIEGPSSTHLLYGTYIEVRSTTSEDVSI